MMMRAMLPDETLTGLLRTMCEVIVQRVTDFDPASCAMLVDSVPAAMLATPIASIWMRLDRRLDSFGQSVSNAFNHCRPRGLYDHLEALVVPR
jgi:hypothetical protein